MLTPFDNVDFCACVTTNLYFKFFVATILGLTLTFATELSVLRKPFVLFSILVLFLLMSFTHMDELGTIVLLFVLFTLSFNMYYADKAKKNELSSRA